MTTWSLAMLKTASQGVARMVWRHGLTVILLGAAAVPLAGRGVTARPHSASRISLCAVGEHGTILTSSDGGASWHGRHSGTWAFLSDVACAGSGHGWIVGDLGMILATSDGGGTWVRQYTKSRDALVAVAVSSRRSGAGTAP